MNLLPYAQHDHYFPLTRRKNLNFDRSERHLPQIEFIIDSVQLFGKFSRGDVVFGFEIPVCFLWGLLGGVAAFVFELFRAYKDGKKFPVRYSRKGYWIVRFLLVSISGFFVVACGVKTPLLAIHVGAATPLIIEHICLNHGLIQPVAPE